MRGMSCAPSGPAPFFAARRLMADITLAPSPNRSPPRMPTYVRHEAGAYKLNVV